MSVLRRFIPNTVAMQITGLVVVSLLLGNALTFAIATYQFRHSERGAHPESAAAQIVTLAELLTRAKSLDEFWNILDGATSMGIKVENVPMASLVATPSLPQEPSFLKRAVEKLAAERALKLVKTLQPADGGSEFVVVDRGGEEALVFRIPSSTDALPLLRGPALTTLTVATLSLLVLSVYAVRWITAPLRSFAEAADDFGRSLKNNQKLNERGPREIAQTARALNDMRLRIQHLVDERTSMLMGISHDLRTPLTRALLRTERLPASPAREYLVADLRKTGERLSDMMAFLRGNGAVEGTERVDLPSLLQTISAEFSDEGRPVGYEGVGHFVYACQPHSLSRAVANVVESTARYGSKLTVSLHAPPGEPVEIELSDSGQSDDSYDALLPAARDKLAPTLSPSGIGIGLSIARDLIAAHGGKIELFERMPRGLAARIILPVDGKISRNIT